MVEIDAATVASFKDEDRFSLRLTVLTKYGEKFSIGTGMLAYDEMGPKTAEMQNLVGVIEQIMREGDWDTDRGVVTVGQWRLRGDTIVGVNVTPVHHKYMGDPG